MKERFMSAFEEVLAANKGGEVKNLLITDGNSGFLDDALYTLRSWALVNRIHLVELDENDDSWLAEIQSRELFDKLNQPDTVLLIKNYATVNFHNAENSPHIFLREVVINRDFVCDDDFDELPNLLFVVVINDLSEMRWRESERSVFTVMHEDEGKTLWVNTQYSRFCSKMHPVMSSVNKIMYLVSADEKTLCFDAGNAFRERKIRRNVCGCSAKERTDIIHTYIENHLPEFCGNVETMIFKMSQFGEEERFVINAERLQKFFPKLEKIYCNDVFEIANAKGRVSILDAFELGERALDLAVNGDISAANHLTRALWALDFKWAEFFCEVAVDFQYPREHHKRCYPDGNVANAGLDKLFRIYLLGWYSKSREFYYDDRVYAEKYQNINKAVELLKIRFKNWEHHEVLEKLHFDLKHVEIRLEDAEWAEEMGEELDEKFKERPDYSGFVSALMETDRLFPGTIDKMYNDGTILSIL